MVIFALFSTEKLVSLEEGINGIFRVLITNVYFCFNSSCDCSSKTQLLDISDPFGRSSIVPIVLKICLLRWI